MTTGPQRRIFIIGPMTKDKTDPKGLEWAKHIPNIRDATQQVLAGLREKMGDTLGNYVVRVPADDPDDITKGVFSEIMHCDLAIADLSKCSPNVVYELAILHANGVPVILLNFKKNEVPEGQYCDMFYLNQQNRTEVADYEVPTLAKALAGNSFDEVGNPGMLERLLLAPPTKEYYNPITKHFDGVALVNVAAATGIATGQHYNFLSWVLAEGGIFADPKKGVDKIILLRPERIKSVDEVKKRLTEAFGAPGSQNLLTRLLKYPLRLLEPVNKKRTKKIEMEAYFYPTPGHPRRGYFIQQYGTFLIDYPTPISSLQTSRQYQDILKFVKNLDEGEEEIELPPFEERLINIYFQTLEKLATSEHNKCDWGKVEILSVDDAIKVLRAQDMGVLGRDR